MIEGKKLGDSAAHGMTTDDRTFQTKMIEHRCRIIGKYIRGVFRRRFARQARTAIIERYEAMVAGELRRLIEIPHRAITRGLAEKQKRRPLTGHFAINIDAVFR